MRAKFVNEDVYYPPEEKHEPFEMGKMSDLANFIVDWADNEELRAGKEALRAGTYGKDESVIILSGNELPNQKMWRYIGEELAYDLDNAGFGQWEVTSIKPTKVVLNLV